MHSAPTTTRTRSFREAGVESGPACLFQFASNAIPGEALRWRREGGAPLVTVVFKATYRLEPGECVLVEDRPEPILVRDARYDHDPKGRIYAPTDLVPVKPSAEIILVGSAPASREALANRVEARVQIGMLNKSIPVDQLTRSSFGALASSAPRRQARLAGRDGPLFDQLGHVPLPSDFDEAFFQAAPSDQWVPELRPDQAIVLEHLVPNHPRFVTRLPGVLPRVSICESDETALENELVADTLWIDTVRGLCTLVWRTTVAPLNPKEPFVVFVGQTKLSRPAERPSGRPTVRSESSFEALRDVASVPTPDGVEETVSLESTEELRVHAGAPRLAAGLDLGGAMPRRHAAADGYEGLVGASNAAADSHSVSTEAQKIERPPARERAPVDLLWFDAAYLDRVRLHPRLGRHIEQAPTPPPPRRVRGRPLVPPTPPASAQSVRERERDEVKSVLARAEPVELERLAEVLRGEGSSAEPLVVVQGQLELKFDEGERLALTVASAQPAAKSDARLRELLGAVEELCQAPLAGSPGLQRDFTNKIRNAWARANRLLPKHFLRENVERLLLERRLYQTRQLKGGERIQAQLGASDAPARVPVYLPVAAGTQLPLFVSLDVRIIAQAEHRLDSAESHDYALHAIAIARSANAT